MVMHLARSLFVAGATFGDVAGSVFVAGATFGDVAGSLVVAGAAFGDERVTFLGRLNLW